jgi:hypothetical protein
MKHVWEQVEGYSGTNVLEFYQLIVNNMVNGDIAVELGSYLGRSISMLSVEIYNSKKDISLFAIDTWEGSDDVAEDHPVSKAYIKIHNIDLRFKFLENLRKHELNNVVSIKEDSVTAAKHFIDNDIAFVFIDANHTYDAVVADINAWYPKVKFGGILSGHDYNDPTVYKAVNSIFSNIEHKGTCWWIIKK